MNGVGWRASPARQCHCGDSSLTKSAWPTRRLRYDWSLPREGRGARPRSVQWTTLLARSTVQSHGRKQACQTKNWSSTSAPLQKQSRKYRNYGYCEQRYTSRSRSKTCRQATINASLRSTTWPPTRGREEEKKRWEKGNRETFQIWPEQEREEHSWTYVKLFIRRLILQLLRYSPKAPLARIINPLWISTSRGHVYISLRLRTVGMYFPCMPRWLIAAVSAIQLLVVVLAAAGATPTAQINLEPCRQHHFSYPELPAVIFFLHTMNR